MIENGQSKKKENKMTVMNILILIIAILWLVAFVYYTKKLNSESSKKSNKMIKVEAPAVMLFCAMYAMSYFAVNAHTRGAMISDPEMLTDAIKALEEKGRKKEMKASEEAVKNISEDDSAFAPVVGNPDGDVVIYEFFDYNCGYCKKGHDAVNEVLAEDTNVKVVLKAYPIFPPSHMPAKALVAAKEQGTEKVAAFNDLLFATNLVPEMNDKTTEAQMNDKITAIVMGVAQKAGLDVAKLKKDMEAPAVEEELQRTRQLAAKLGIQGTPAYVVGKQKFGGFIPAAKMKEAIAASRK